MTKKELLSRIIEKKSFLCVGLDPEPDKIPQYLNLTDDPIFEFNKAIIDATNIFCVAYKPNLAFYESLGINGLRSLEKTMEYIKKNYPEQFLIADAKRGDIGNTSRKYAEAFFKHHSYDAITISPYMGSDSVIPFLNFKKKWVIILALTSNQGAFDFQYISDNHGEKLFKKVISVSSQWGNDENMMYVIGATKADMLTEIRKIIPDHFLLVPGVGAQGGSLAEVAEYGMNTTCGLLVNSSRGILYAGTGKDFAEKSAIEAKKLQLEMSSLLLAKGIL